MEFFILQDVEVDFPPPPSTSSTDTLITRYSEYVETEIKTAQKDDGAKTDLYTKKLTSALIEDLSDYKSKGSTL